MPEKELTLEPIIFRIGLVVAGVAIAAFLLLSATWFFGDAIARGANDAEIAELAKSMAPDDPKAYQAASLIAENSFLEEDLKTALKNAETAVSLSPHDYLLWKTLARMRERSGDIAGAERALRKSADLAPNDAEVQWALGNVLLRQEKFDEAFRLIRTAVDSNPAYAGPAASIAWDIYSGDLTKVKKAVGKAAHVTAALAVYLANQKRFDESYEIWKTISEKDRRGKYAAEGQSLLALFGGNKKYLTAVALSSELALNGSSVPKVGTVTNGGFEFDISSETAGMFNWTIAAGNVPSIGVSVEERSSGRKSLVLQFEGGPGNEFREVAQTVAVQNGQSYTFAFKTKSQLKTDVTLRWRILDALSGSILATSDPIPATVGWQEFNMTFTVPEESEGIIVRLVRADCSDLRCPIVGTVWFDDISIK